MQKWKQWYIHYLFVLLNNPTFQLDWKRTKKFQLKLFNTALTLTYGQGNWKWYEQVKLNEQHHHAKFDIYHICGVWVNPNVKILNKPRHLTNEKQLSPLNIHQSHTNHTAHNPFNVCSNHTTFKLQRTRIQNMQFAV